MTAIERWKGLRIEGRRLCYRPPSPWWRRSTLRFEPEGLVIVNPDGSEELLSWSAPRGAWQVDVQRGGNSQQAGTKVEIGPSNATSLGEVVWARTVWLPSHWQAPPWDALPALVEHLRSTPAAASGLDVVERVRMLVGDLRTGGWRRPLPPTRPLLGDALDAFVAVSGVVEESGWRKHRGRPVRGEAVPDAGVLAALARRRLRPDVADRLTDDVLLAVVERHLDVGPWPFDRLLAP
ncbi:hypothetical protein KSP35_09370 [Aquihabitans sp. G128]|uniref:hypothetical protein n=1 Tax=Aquihabitans sp. G128 TaxID=2849779 RepID=UPI001C216A7F|nr:hypothetical protein [Aquihabitans sp. G128]QXC62967.1 hypothetical protein KSP35_09370 [Aquihabitans sp. G128]